MSLARRIAEFIVSLDDQSINHAHKLRLEACLLNGYGIALGGRDTPFYRCVADAIMMSGETGGGATMLYTGAKATPASAALANAALFHGRAQEDTCGTVHVGAVVLPLLTAMLETGRYPLDRLLPALLAGYETAGLLDLQYGRITAPAGFRASAVYGTLGAAAAAGRLAGLDVDQMTAAIANAAAFTGGVLQSFVEGTDEWRYQVGIAARNGFTAAMLAAAGSVSAGTALEGSAGLIKALTGSAAGAVDLADGLGREWAIERVTFKPYPVCAFSQTPVAAALHVRGNMAPKTIARIRVRMNLYESGYPGMTERGPFHSISGTLMSIPFCIATTMLRGVPTMQDMMTFDEPSVQALVQKIEVVTDPNVPNLSSILEIDTDHGTIVHEQFMTAKDFAYDFAETSALIRRIGREQNIPAPIYDRLEMFVKNLPHGSISQVVDLFEHSA